MFGEALKRLDRLATNLVQICEVIWEWTYAKYNSPLNTPGGLGVYNFKSLGKLSNNWTDWHQIGYTSADSSGNGHRLNTISPSISKGAFWGVLGGHKLKSCQTAGPIGTKFGTHVQIHLGMPNKLPKFKSMLKLSNNWTDWHQIWYTSADSYGNGHRLNTIRSSISQGEFWGF